MKTERDFQFPRSSLKPRGSGVKDTMKRTVLILATLVFWCPLANEASAAAVSRQTKGEAAKKAEMALACYFGLRHPQDFREARRQAALAGET